VKHERLSHGIRTSKQEHAPVASRFEINDSIAALQLLRFISVSNCIPSEIEGNFNGLIHSQSTAVFFCYCDCVELRCRRPSDDPPGKTMVFLDITVICPGTLPTLYMSSFFFKKKVARMPQLNYRIQASGIT